MAMPCLPSVGLMPSCRREKKGGSSMILKNRPITRHYQMLQKMAKRVQGCMAGIAHDDVVENFDFEKLPTRMRSRVFFMSASDGVGSPLGWLCYVHRRFMCIKKGGSLGAVRICSASASKSRLAVEHYFPCSHGSIWLGPGPQILGNPKRTAYRNRNQRILSCANVVE